MSFQDDRERVSRRKPDDDANSAEARRPRTKRNAQPTQVGDALRTVYQRTIDEDIPPEMLDLLGKLG